MTTLANAFIERWIQSIQYECLNHFIVLGQQHLDYLVSQYVDYYHFHRPHQSLENKPLTEHPPPDDDVPTLKLVQCHERLGGLLKHYSRRAA
ncbi:MAG: transposase [Pirellulales bacterium]|nr:transposase [Pirellulales bacterium]